MHPSRPVASPRGRGIAAIRPSTRLALVAALCLAVGAIVGVSAPAPADAAAGRTAITAGRSHSCAVTSTAGVDCWGDNLYGQLGDGTLLSRWTPVAVVGLPGAVKAISASGDHTCALTKAGGVACWGSNSHGQLGDGGTTDSPVPVDVVGLSTGVRAISAGYAHTCAITKDGAALCWGANYNGALGDGTTTDRLTPVVVSGLAAGVVSISAGGDDSCAVTTAGAAKCWGANYRGVLGDGTTTTRLTPVNVVGLTRGVVAISAGAYVTCAITDAGAAKCWGSNVGDGTRLDRLTPTQVVGLQRGVKRIEAGETHTCALKKGGAAFCWGANYYGAIGDGTTSDRLRPAAVSGMKTGVTAITAGGDHTCALAPRGVPKCWGDGLRGQVGDDTLTNRSKPVKVRFLPVPDDSTPPVWTKLPTNGMQLGAQLNPAILGDCDSYHMPVKISWLASDPESGIHHYAHGLEAEATDASNIVFGTSTTRTGWVDDAACGGGGNDQEFYAYNNAGLYSEDAYWSDQVLEVVQDDATQDLGWDVPHLEYAGQWSTSACNCWSGGTTQKTKKSAAAVTLHVPDSYGGGYGVGLVMAEGPGRGKAAVFVDNVKVATVDTRSPTAVNRTVVWRQALATGSHTIKVVNLATPGRQRIDVDAFVLMRK
jgi:alpha-tubulin suppressor-like RCC1 family protein